MNSLVGFYYYKINLICLTEKARHRIKSVRLFTTYSVLYCTYNHKITAYIDKGT